MSHIRSLLLLVIVFSLSVSITPIPAKVAYEWSFLNFTWESTDQYMEAQSTGQYIPTKVLFSGVKFYQDRVYFATPNYKGGVPFTMGYISRYAKNKTNIPLVPFPNSLLNRKENCSLPQNVLAYEIDRKGLMWLFDGVRISNATNCPAKLLIYDLKKNATLIHTYVFPNDVCHQNGCFLNDVVVDDHQQAYITDSSNADPGLVVFCWNRNKAWKFRHPFMFPGDNGLKNSIDQYSVPTRFPIDGIALSPIPSSENKSRTLYFSSLTGYDLYSVPTDVLNDDTLYETGNWRNSVARVGKKQSSTDGMMMDNRGNLYYTLVPLKAIGKWNTSEPFDKSNIIYRDPKMVWPESFGMDEEGYLYANAKYAIDNFVSSVQLNHTVEKIKFRIYKFKVGNRSYMYEK